MGLKTYALRLDEDVYENLKKSFEDYGDPDLNISFVIRKYLRDLNDALPHLRKSDLGVMNNLAFWGLAWKQLIRTAQVEKLLKGEAIVERAQAEVDDRKKFKEMKEQGRKKGSGKV